VEPEVGNDEARAPLETNDGPGAPAAAAEPAEPAERAPEPASEPASEPAPGPSPEPAPGPSPEPAPEPSPELVPPPALTIPKSRAGGAWKGLIPALVATALILVFVFQNLRETKVSFFTWSGRFPLALAILVAAGLGALVVFLLGSVRIVQLRKAFRHHQSEHATTREES
jgi:putative membrane protein